MRAFPVRAICSQVDYSVSAEMERRRSRGRRSTSPPRQSEVWKLCSAAQTPMRAPGGAGWSGAPAHDEGEVGAAEAGQSLGQHVSQLLQHAGARHVLQQAHRCAPPALPRVRATTLPAAQAPGKEPAWAFGAPSRQLPSQCGEAWGACRGPRGEAGGGVGGALHSRVRRWAGRRRASSRTASGPILASSSRNRCSCTGVPPPHHSSTAHLRCTPDPSPRPHPRCWLNQQ